MANTQIEWADKVWNPVTGCVKISAGCQNCYAERIARRFWEDRDFTDVQTHPDRLEQPLHWRKPARIFVNSMSDLYHPLVPSDFIQQVFDVMDQAIQHTFIILTKRPERAIKESRVKVSTINHNVRWPLINVWQGVSVETIETAYERIPLLAKIPACVRFVSFEPLLHHVYLPDELFYADDFHYLDWVIVGGETGPGARPMHPRWVRTIRDQCLVRNIPFFFKGWGEYLYLGDRDGDPVYDRVGRNKMNRLVDGRFWNQYPWLYQPERTDETNEHRNDQLKEHS